MIPFRTTAPCLRSPVVTASMIFVNIAVFFYQEGLSDGAQHAFVVRFALIPAIYGDPAWSRAVELDPGRPACRCSPTPSCTAAICI